MDLKGKVCVVAGGSSGLGAAAVEVLAERGAHVAIFDVAPPARSLGSAIPFMPCDVTDDDAVAAAVDAVVARWDGLHVCVNCAGIIRSASVLAAPGRAAVEAFRRTIDINLTGTFIVAARAAEAMAKNKPGPDGERGVIINTSSIAAMDASSSAAYAASKGGVASLSLTIARELAAFGIRINAIAPGPMETTLFDGLSTERAAEVIGKTVFPKRLGYPREFGELVAHIAENRLFNASLIRFDGGARV